MTFFLDNWQLFAGFSLGVFVCIVADNWHARRKPDLPVTVMRDAHNKLERLLSK